MPASKQMYVNQKIIKNVIYEFMIRFFMMIDNVINISMYAYDLHKTGGISPTYNSNIVHPQIGTKHQRILTGRRFYNSP
jgi:hypothetical protein